MISENSFLVVLALVIALFEFFDQAPFVAQFSHPPFQVFLISGDVVESHPRTFAATLIYGIKVKECSPEIARGQVLGSLEFFRFLK